jgi:5-methylcytosine-specific restriction endonuclease McrA
MLLGRRRLPPSAYRDYMTSPAWYGSPARRAAMDRARGRCRACGRRELLEAHHWTYRHLGHEWPWDLVALCDHCHTGGLLSAHRLARLLTGSRTRGLWVATPLALLLGRRPVRIAIVTALVLWSARILLTG